MSAESDAFFSPQERWDACLDFRRWVDRLHARELLDELIGTIDTCSQDRQDTLFRLLHQQLETTEDVAERLHQQQEADAPSRS